MMTSAADIQLAMPLSGFDKDRLEKDGKYNATIDGIPFTENEGLSHNPASIAYTGRCEEFDLSKTEDRVKYADLCAKLIANADYSKLWEERVQRDGRLIIYITYLEISMLSNKTIEDL